MAESHDIDGTPISDYAIVQQVEYGIGDTAGEDVSLPYQGGLLAGNRTLKGRDYTLGLLILGATGSSPAYSRAQYLENVQALAALLLNVDGDGHPQPFTLTRTLELPGGGQVCTIAARYRDGLRLDQQAAHAGRAAVVLTLLDPWWIDGSSNPVYA